MNTMNNSFSYNKNNINNLKTINTKSTQIVNNDLIFDVAKWFLYKSSMTNKKLQKLCYYAYVWSIVLLNDDYNNLKSISKNGFEAWVHGPVCRQLYNKYRDYGWNDIPKEEKEPNLPNELKEVLNEVWDAYGWCSAGQLEALTHKEEPWINARKGLDQTEPSNNKIDDIDIFNFYMKQLQ